MILKTLSIDVFAGLSSREFSFEPGLNVVLGPNEAGKSTLFRAVALALTTPSRLGKRDADRILARYLPVSGGDTIAVELSFDHDGRTYRLARRWGGSPATRLELPDGGLITSDEEARQVLVSCFPAPQATVESVFLARQSGLGDTVARLKERPEVFTSLSDLLRRSVLESAGVSVEGFRRLVEEEIRAAFGRWDRDRKMPEQGRGIDRPWKRDAGRVVEAWYRVERVKRDLERLEAGERELASRIERIATLEAELSEVSGFLDEHRGAFEAVSRIEVLDATLGAKREALTTIRRDYDRWPELEREAKEAADEIARLEASVETLVSSLDQARAAERDAAKYASLAERKRRVDEARVALAELEQDDAVARPVTRAQYESLRSMRGDHEELSRALASGHLTVTAHSDADTTIEVTEHGTGAREIRLEAGHPDTQRFAGAVSIAAGGVELHIQSGVDDPVDLGNRLREIEHQYTSLLASVGVADLDEAAKRSEAYQRARIRIESLEADVAGLLDGSSYDEIAGALEQRSATEAGSVEELASELARDRERLSHQSARFAETQAAIEGLRSTYASRDGAFSAMTRVAGEVSQLEAERKTLPGIPETFDDGSSFRVAMERAEHRREAIKAERERLVIDRIEIEASLPDISAEELEREYQTARHEFERELTRGNALSRVLDHTNRLLETPDNALFDRVETHFARLISRATCERYTGSRGWEGVPDVAMRSDGLALDYAKLSAGTKDLFSLCLRLALVACYTEQSEGFVMLDDPLVDLDPVRQQTGATMIEEFSDTTQRIVFTCHPGHADLFRAGNRVPL